MDEETKVLRGDHESIQVPEPTNYSDSETTFFSVWDLIITSHTDGFQGDDI